MTIRAVIQPGHAAPLAAWLTTVDTGGRRAALLPFERLPVHFARFVVLQDTMDLDGNPLPAAVMFTSDIDGPPGPYIERLVDVAREGIDEVFGHCEAYPAAPTDRQRVTYLRSRMIKANAAYINTVGRSVDQVRQEERLRNAIEQFLDRPEHDWWRRSDEDVLATVRRHIAGDPDLAWALRPARPPSWWWRAKELGHLVVTALAVLLLLPFVLVVVPFWLIAIRLAERRDVPYTGRPDPARLRELADREDWIVQNQFSAVGYLKPGWLRRVTVTVVLLGINVGSRHLFNRGSLAGVRTIHFARWVFIDGGRRMIFISNYDGSLENYMDDFIDKIAWSLNAAFSNGVGYPKTRWLIGGGANDEEAFKNFLRSRQVPTQLWYSAYPTLTAANIARNARIRAGLSGRGGATGAEAAREWARQL